MADILILQIMVALPRMPMLLLDTDVDSSLEMRELVRTGLLRKASEKSIRRTLVT